MLCESPGSGPELLQAPAVFSSRGVEVVDVLKADGPGCLVVYSLVGVEQPRSAPQ